MEEQKGYLVGCTLDGPVKVFIGNEAKQRAQRYELKLKSRHKYEDNDYWVSPIEVEIE